MKKTFSIIIVVIVSILLILTIPLPIFHNDVCGEGKAVSFNSLTYQIIKWDMYPDSLKPYRHTDYYFIPNIFYSVEQLWENHQNDLRNDGYGAILSYAVVTEKNENHVLVANIEYDKICAYHGCLIDKTDFQQNNLPFENIEVGTKLKITYDGYILESYPSQFGRVYKIELY